MGKASSGAQDSASKSRLEKPHPNPKKKLVPKFADTPSPKTGSKRKAMYL